jgi:fermentation-respiration switch protein FrsA (DUF1100 family)
VVDGAGVDDVLIERGVDYGLGKLADVYRPGRDGPAPLALLWHGIGVAERDVLEPLAVEVAGLGVAVIVPDWESEVPDGGRMAASLALNPETAGGWRPSAVVCLAGGFHRETVMSPAGNGPIADLARAAAAKPVPFHLVHGIRDTRVDIRQSRDFAAAAASHGWPVRLAEPDTDHAGIVMTEWDAARQRCRPTTEPHAVTAGRLSARTIAEAARTIPGTARTAPGAAR